MRNLSHFAIGIVVKKLNIRVLLLSRYRYQGRYIKIDPGERIFGGLSRMVFSLINFSFIRSIVAHKYSLRGFAYDPVSLFLIELFSYLEKLPHLKAFTDLLQDPVRGEGLACVIPAYESGDVDDN